MTDRPELIYGKRQFTVNVDFNCRKQLTITVHPDCSITAMAPKGYELAAIRQRLERRRSWIARQISFFEQFQPAATERKYVSGETHYYLGRQYRLKISNGQTARVRLVGRFFKVELSVTDDRSKAREVMQQWYTEHAKIYLTRQIENYWPLILDRGAQKPAVQFRRMKKRWGSCSNKGTITLNTELIKLPTYCIDYVIVHELCHMARADHDNIFYRNLGRILPDWETRKDRLEKAASAITVTN